MNKIYKIYLISDSTGETLDRIFLAIKAQFSSFECKTIHFSFTRTKNQIDKIISKYQEDKDVIVLYTIVDSGIVKFLTTKCRERKIPCFEVLGSLIDNFSKLLKKEANRKPSGQHVLDEEYYKRIEAVQFTMSHDDGKIISESVKAKMDDPSSSNAKRFVDIAFSIAVFIALFETPLGVTVFSFWTT